jgi:hypothetical protein
LEITREERDEMVAMEEGRDAEDLDGGGGWGKGGKG